VKLNSKKNQALARALPGKPLVVVILLLLCIVLISAAVQADDSTAQDQTADTVVLDTGETDADQPEEPDVEEPVDSDAGEPLVPFPVEEAPEQDVFYDLPAEIIERDSRPDSLEPQIISETRGPDGTDTVITINAFQDAFISSRNPNTAYGLYTILNLGYDQVQYDAMRILMQWDLSSIPSNAVINNATASFYQTYITPPGDNLDIQAQYVTAPWYESSVTWNNANYLGGDIIGVGTSNSNLGWKAVNVTELVRTWKSGAKPNYGVVFTGDERDWQTRYRTWYSRQKPGFTPYLTVDYTVTCDTVPPVAYLNALPTFSASTFTVSWGGTDYAPAGCPPTGINYYDVEYRRDGGGWTAFASHVTFTSQDFNGGANGAQYEFRIRAVDNAGNSQAWTQTQAQTTVDTIPPNATVNPLPQYTYADNFVLTWSGTDNLSGIQQYDLQYQVGNQGWANAPFNPTTTTSFHVTGLQSGVTYSFRARAMDKVGNVQPWPENAQASTTVTLEPISLVKPFNPPILKPTAPTPDRFVVSWEGWTAPGTSITKFDVYWQFNNGAWQTMGTYSGSTFSDTFIYPNGDGRYGFEVVATNSLGQTETRNYVAEAVIIVDMADAYHVAARIPIIFSEAAP
jgi:hypothetical protein